MTLCSQSDHFQANSVVGVAPSIDQCTVCSTNWYTIDLISLAFKFKHCVLHASDHICTKIHGWRLPLSQRQNPFLDVHGARCQKFSLRNISCKTGRLNTIKSTI